jgi:hypothetical protein
VASAGRSAGDVQQLGEHLLGDLQHLGRGLVALLVLDQARRLFVEVDAGAVGRADSACVKRASEMAAVASAPWARTPTSASAAM